MNQILVTEKLYITPELKKKKRMFKIEFFISVFLVCLLSSYYIYAEYNRNESEQVSQQILSEMNSDNTIKKADSDDIMVIMVNDEKQDESEVNENEISSSYTALDGTNYSIDARIRIPSIGIEYPVLSETSDELLKISVNKYWAPNGANEVGNYCIVGHNYRNGKMFGRLHELANGDRVELEDLTGRKVTYQVYNKYVVKPTDTRCTSQKTNGKKELTLITCTNYGKERLIVKCRQI